MYSDSDSYRIYKESQKLEEEKYRTEFRKDYARILHSPGFRRLQAKTQLFPGHENDFFRNRLTHSLEVAQIAKSIATRLNYNYDVEIDTDLVESCSLAHDIGHPPFGHQGEEALDECLLDNGGFEGNAQTIRVLTVLEKKIIPNPKDIIVINDIDNRIGLNLTFRTLASLLKYDNVIPFKKNERENLSNSKVQKIKPVKGYYEYESDLIRKIKKNVLPNKYQTYTLRTIECEIMEIADDIAYCTYDLEDTLKAGFVRPLDLITLDINMLSRLSQNVSESLNKKITEDHILYCMQDIFSILFEESEWLNKLKCNFTLKNFNKTFNLVLNDINSSSKYIGSNGAARISLTSGLVGRFIRSVELDYNKKIPVLSKIKIDEDKKLQIEVLKRLTYLLQIQSPKLKIVAYRGKEIVKRIYNALSEGEGFELLPFDVKELYDNASENYKKRIICDFIASMTDRYAIELYGRLVSERPETIFKPF